jgi:hypothetical protein
MSEQEFCILGPRNLRDLVLGIHTETLKSALPKLMSEHRMCTSPRAARGVGNRFSVTCNDKPKQSIQSQSSRAKPKAVEPNPKQSKAKAVSLSQSSQAKAKAVKP